MFDFIRKPFLWDAWNQGLEKEIGKADRFHLKTVQDLAVYDLLKNKSGMVVAEIGGGNSRILGKLSRENRCFNVEKFEGADGGPSGEISVDGVENIKVFLGEFSPLLSNGYFDIIFSVSVVEHVSDLNSFLEDGLRVLKPGGLWLHAIDIYIEDEPSPYWRGRFESYRNWCYDLRLKPKGGIFQGPLRFTNDIATNPDDIMYAWGRISPSLTPLRQRAQSASVLVAVEKL